VRLPSIDRVARFADYGFTGGFFLISQLILLWASGYWPNISDAIHESRFSLPTDTSLVGPIITGFAGALALIAVFVVGLLLDLLASAFRSFEMRVFARHLDHNSNWITQLIEAHKAYCGIDYETFQSAFHELSLARQLFAGFEIFMFWKRESRLHYMAAMKLTWGLAQARRYERLRSFFTSYIDVLSGSAQLTLMVDQYSLWRTARAIATSLCICLMEALVLSRWELLSPSNGLSPAGIPVGTLVLYLIIILGTFLSYYFTLGTYSRLCFTIFSLVYVTYDRQNEPLKNVAPAP